MPIVTNNTGRAKTGEDKIYGGKQMDNIEVRNGMVSIVLCHFLKISTELCII